MSRPTPETLVRRVYARLEEGDLDGAAACYADDAVNHGRRVGRDGMRAVFGALLSAFPDIRFEIVDVLADGDRIACAMRMRGTHLGEPTLATVFQGALAGVAPTGRAVDVAQLHTFRVERGSIVEHDAVRDDLGLLAQLGLAPPPRPPEAP